jgi:hypothetical protein
MIFLKLGLLTAMTLTWTAANAGTKNGRQRLSRRGERNGNI